MDNPTKYIVLFALMAIVLYLVLQFILMAGDRAKMEREIRAEYQKAYDEAKANMTFTIAYGCVYYPPDMQYWNLT